MLRRSSLVECVSVLPGNRCLQNVEKNFLRQYVQPCLLKNPKYTFYTIKSSLKLAYNLTDESKFGILWNHNSITVKVILLSWLFGRNTCKVVPWRYNKTKINCNGLLNLSNELEKKKTVIFSYSMVNFGILKITFNCFLT